MIPADTRFSETVKALAEAGPTWWLTAAASLLLLICAAFIVMLRRHPRKLIAVSPNGAGARRALAEADVGAPLNPRFARIFVSSTFADMQDERNALVRGVFPKIRDAMRKRGVEVTDIDLRWGITGEQVEKGDVLPICLAEIDRCKPFFVGIMGERYGSIIEVAPAIRAAYPALKDAGQISATECEFLHGVFGPSATPENVIIFERISSEGAPVAAIPDIGAEPLAMRDRQHAFKMRVKQSGVRVVAYASVDEFARVLQTEITRMLDAAFPKDRVNFFSSETREHEAFALSFCDAFVPVGDDVNALKAWLLSDGNPVAVIAGADGTGKTALIANFLKTVKADQSFAAFEHYGEAAPEATNLMTLLRRMREGARRLEGSTDYELLATEFAGPDSAEKMAERVATMAEDPSGSVNIGVFLGGKRAAARGLRERLERAAAVARKSKQRLLIAIDGLDAIEDATELAWLPDPIPPNVKILLTSDAPVVKQQATARGWLWRRLAPLSELEKHQIVAAVLEKWGRSLSEDRIAKITQATASNSPIFVRMALDELRSFAVEGDIDARLQSVVAAQDLAGLVDPILTRLESECGAAFVKAALALILASRAGLEETDVLELSGGAPLQWARLRLGLEQGLRASRGRIVFANATVRECATKRYFSVEAERQAVHERLAEHILARPFGAREAEELPFQLCEAKAYDKLRDLLSDLDKAQLLIETNGMRVLSYWSALKLGVNDVAEILAKAFSDRVGAKPPQRAQDLALGDVISNFLHQAGASGDGYVQLSALLAQAAPSNGGPVLDQLRRLEHLAAAKLESGDFDGAEKILGDVLKSKLARLGSAHRETVSTLCNLATTAYRKRDIDRSVELFQRALSSISAATEEPELTQGDVLTNFGILLSEIGARRQAVEALKSALDLRTKRLGPSDVSTIATANNLGTALRADAQYEEARQVLASVLAARRQMLGDQHASTLTSIAELARCLGEMGDIAGARKVLDGLVGSAQTIDVGDEAANTALLKGAELLFNIGDLESAERIEARIMDARLRRLGERHPATLLAIDNLAGTLFKKGDVARASELYERAATGRREVLGPAHADTLLSTENWVQALIDLKEFDRARPYLATQRKILEEVYGPAHPRLLSNMRLAANLEQLAGRADDARQTLEVALMRSLEAHGEAHIETAIAKQALSAFLRESGDVERADHLAAEVAAWQAAHVTKS